MVSKELEKHSPHAACTSSEEKNSQIWSRLCCQPDSELVLVHKGTLVEVEVWHGC